MKNNGNSNGNGHNGNGSVATIEAVKTNGNGNGFKAVETEKPANPIKIVEEVKRATIVPRFDQLAPKGVEILRNMGDIANAKLFLDDLAMQVQDETTIACLTALLEAISDKAEEGDNAVTALDFINDLQDHLFSWTHESTEARQGYINAIKTGNFIVERFVKPDSDEVEENVDFRTRGTVEEFPSLIETDEAEEEIVVAKEPDDFNDRLAQHHLSILANKIHHVLTSDKVSDGVKESLQFIIFSAGNEANLGIDDAELVKVSLPKLINSLNLQYGKGITDSLYAILDNSLPEEVDAEIYQYATRLEPAETLKKAA